tara:strand:- start:8607 stop:9473 length:867 start_codon:yes stop_codon:yes gene_type:complete
MIKNQVLGTAQFGLNYYGVSNFEKRKKDIDIYPILDKAFESGIRYFDTAPGYKSEKILGNFIKTNNLAKNVKIITKVPTLGHNNKNFSSKIRKSIENSLNNLKVEKIFCLLMHDQLDITKVEKEKSFLFKIKKDYNIKNFGFSVYDLKFAKYILRIFPDASLQFPYNFLNDAFQNLKNNGNLFFGRSIFCQGFLINSKIKNIKKKIKLSHEKYFKFLHENNIDPIELCLDFAYSNKHLNYIIYGVRNIDELKKIINYKDKQKIDKKLINKAKLYFKGQNIDPRTWSSK